MPAQSGPIITVLAVKAGLAARFAGMARSHQKTYLCGHQPHQHFSAQAVGGTFLSRFGPQARLYHDEKLQPLTLYSGKNAAPTSLSRLPLSVLLKKQWFYCRAAAPDLPDGCAP